jgi:hypothetical protein
VRLQCDVQCVVVGGPEPHGEIVGSRAGTDARLWQRVRDESMELGGRCVRRVKHPPQQALHSEIPLADRGRCRV